MINLGRSSLELTSSIRSMLISTHSQRRAFCNLHIANKVDIKWQNMKWDESLAEKARSLIFGEKRYAELTPREQELVDYYQQKKLEEDGIILPNTRAALEQAEIEQIILNRHNKQ